jgi:transmembrane sensor
MSRLVFPLKPMLRDGFAESDVQRVWRGIQIRPTESARSLSKGRWAMASGAVVALALILALSLWHGRKAVHAPLELAGGGLPSVFEAAPVDSKRQVDLADGSRIALTRGARLDVLANDGVSFLTVLRRGRSTFDVYPGGPRRWVIECGLGTLEVVGTAFTVERTPGRLEVTVAHGVVSVTGENVPGHKRMLGAGERLVVTGSDPDESRVIAPAASPVPAQPRAMPPSSDPQARSEPPAPHPASPPIKNGRADLDDLVRRADAARRAGDLAAATELLERAVTEARGDPRGGIAALTLARLNLGRSPARVASALSTALASGPPRGLEEDLLARLVQARARAGDHEGAQQAAREYQRRFPAGARLEEVKRWAAE